MLPTQLRLAQIVERMHTASLLHDDVIDASALRRGAPTAPASFGNRLSILGGNFVLGRASAALSRLGDSEVTELIANVLSNLVEGEILQMRGLKLDADVATTSGEGDTGKEFTKCWRTNQSRCMEYLPAKNLPEDREPDGQGCPLGGRPGRVPRR